MNQHARPQAAPPLRIDPTMLPSDPHAGFDALRADHAAVESMPRMIGFGGIRQITPMPVRIA